MNEKKDNYLKAYLKENLVVLLFELVIVVLLACICSLMLGGEPVWLAPVLAVFAYLMDELRFMMSYIATCARKAREEAEASQTAAHDPSTPAEEPALTWMQEQEEAVSADIVNEDDEEDDEDDEQAPYHPLASMSGLGAQEEISEEPQPDAPVIESFDEPLDALLGEEPDELAADVPNDTGGDLLVADIDLFDEPFGELDDVDEAYEADIDAPDPTVPNEPILEQPSTAEAWRAAFGVPVTDVLDVRDDEDPFSH